MIYQKKTINNVPTKVPLSNSAPVGNPIGTIISTYKKIQPRNYLYCDGSTFDETLYPALYLYLGTNVLPDYRECAIVGAEKNTTDVFDSTETDPSTGLPGTQNHDVYTQGQFKDDQLQDHYHSVGSGRLVQTGGSNPVYASGNQGGSDSATGRVFETSSLRRGDTTRGKRKAVYYYIKAVDGVDISDEDTFLNTVKDYVDEKNSYSTDEMLTSGTWIDGKPIYRKVVNFGALPNTTLKEVAHNISNISEIIEQKGFAKSSNEWNYYPLPYTDFGVQDIQIYINKQAVGINTQSDYSDFTGYIIMEYTKTTD